MSKQLITTEPSSLATQEPSIGHMLLAFVEKGITPESVGAFTQLCELKKQMDDRENKTAYARAFLELKRNLPPIKANKPVMNKDGVSVRYTFAPLEEIDAILAPVALRHGFTYAFAEGEAPAGRVAKVCIVTHERGHSTEHKYTVRIGNGPPGSSESQSDGAAHSYAKRGALCDAFGIVTEKDTDAARDDVRNEGAPITQKQADELRDLCDFAQADREKFLKNAAAVERFEDITTENLEQLTDMLRRRIK